MGSGQRKSRPLVDKAVGARRRAEQAGTGGGDDGRPKQVVARHRHTATPNGGPRGLTTELSDTGPAPAPSTPCVRASTRGRATAAQEPAGARPPLNPTHRSRRQRRACPRDCRRARAPRGHGHPGAVYRHGTRPPRTPPAEPRGSRGAGQGDDPGGGGRKVCRGRRRGRPWRMEKRLGNCVCGIVWLKKLQAHGPRLHCQPQCARKLSRMLLAWAIWGEGRRFDSTPRCDQSGGHRRSDQPSSARATF